jgi:phosphoglycolate phosphatase
MLSIIGQAKNFLSRLSFRTGVVLVILCVICYIVSFAQMLLPISVAAKGVLWIVFFGLAKTFQYSALAVLGVEGVRRVKQWWKNRK